VCSAQPARQIVSPAQAGAQFAFVSRPAGRDAFHSWMPAFAGMTSNNQRFAGRMLRKSRRM
jgi:hypothetical protein